MNMEQFETGTGQILKVHSKDKCVGEYCCIHNPSNHPLKDAKLHWRDDKSQMERICEHGVGHPDPDELAFLKRNNSELFKMFSVHGCDGCCS